MSNCPTSERPYLTLDARSFSRPNRRRSQPPIPPAILAALAILACSSHRHPSVGVARISAAAAIISQNLVLHPNPSFEQNLLGWDGQTASVTSRSGYVVSSGATHGLRTVLATVTRPSTPIPPATTPPPAADALLGADPITLPADPAFTRRYYLSATVATLGKARAAVRVYNTSMNLPSPAVPVATSAKRVGVIVTVAAGAQSPVVTFQLETYGDQLSPGESAQARFDDFKVTLLPPPGTPSGDLALLVNPSFEQNVIWWDGTNSSTPTSHFDWVITPDASAGAKAVSVPVTTGVDRLLGADDLLLLEPNATAIQTYYVSCAIKVTGGATAAIRVYGVYGDTTFNRPSPLVTVSGPYQRVVVPVDVAAGTVPRPYVVQLEAHGVPQTPTGTAFFDDLQITTVPPAGQLPCTGRPDGTSCSDGNACNGDEFCHAGVCTAGTPLQTDDANLCTLDSCDPATGLITHRPDPAHEGQSCGGTGCQTNVCQLGACIPDPARPPTCAIVPFLSCVTPNATGGVTAVFGYTSTATETVNAAIPIANSFSPGPADRGQPQWFAAGTNNSAAAVNVSSGTVTWTLGMRTASASAADLSAHRCSDTQVTQANGQLFFDRSAALAGTIVSSIVGSDPVGTVPGSLQVSNTGAAAYSIPIAVPTGRRGIQPSISLTYNSADTTNGRVGVGWSLAGLSVIHRCQPTIAQDGNAGPQTLSNGGPFCLDGQRLVPLASNPPPDPFTGTIFFNTEVDSFTQISAFPAGSPQFFQVKTRDGRTLTYGFRDNSQAASHGARYASFAVNPDSATEDPVDYSHIAIVDWPLTEVADLFDNRMTITYTASALLDVNATNNAAGHPFERYPAEIRYTDHGTTAGLRSVVFRWADNRTPTSQSSPIDSPPVRFLGGAKLVTTKLLEGIDIKAPDPVAPAVVRSYSLTYERSPSTRRARLVTIRECDGQGACKPATTFGYTDDQGFEEVATSVSGVDLAGGGGVDDRFKFAPMAGLEVGDVNGDGLDDIVYQDRGSLATISYRLSSGRDFGTGRGLGFTLTRATPILADLDGDGSVEVGVFGIASTGAAGGYYEFCRPGTDANGNPTCVPVDGSFQPAAETAALPPFEMLGFFPADLNGDGLPEMVRSVVDPTDIHNYLLAARLNVNGQLQSTYTPFVPVPLVNASSRSLLGGVEARDLDGDGRDEVLIIPSQKLTAWSIAANNQASFVQTNLVTHRWLVDVNGDDLPDELEQVPDFSRPVGSAKIVLRMNTGNGFLPAVDTRLLNLTPGVPFPNGQINDHDDAVRIVDHDGDGQQDLVMMNGGGLGDVFVQSFAPDGTSLAPRDTGIPVGEFANGPSGVVPQDNCLAFRCRYIGMLGPYCYPLPHTKDELDPSCFGPTYPQPPYPYGYQLSRPLDVNGDGLVDYIRFEKNAPETGHLILSIHRGPKPDLLKTVKNGLGVETDVTYQPLSNRSLVSGRPFYSPGPSADPPEAGGNGSALSACPAGQGCRKGKLWVVSEVVRDNGFSNDRWLHTRFAYKDGRYDRKGYGSLGFLERWEETERAQGAGLVRTTTHQVFSLNDTAAAPFLVGVPKITESIVRHVGDGGSVDARHDTVETVSTLVTIAPINGGHRLVTVLPTGSTADRYQSTNDQRGSSALSHVETTKIYGTFGRLKYFVSTVRDGVGTILRTDETLVTQFHPDSVSAFRIGPPLEVVVTSTAGGRQTSSTTRYDYDLGKLFLTGVHQEPAGTADERVDVTITPTADGTGQIAQIQAADASATTGVNYGYDPLEAIYQETATNALGQTSTVIYHPALDAPAFTRAANGVVIGYVYDGFGRPRITNNPPGVGREFRDYFASPLRSVGQRAGGTVVTTYLDRLGRAIKTQTTLPGGAISEVDTTYDEVGRVKTATQPHLPNQSVFTSTYAYDELGRIVTINVPAEDGHMVEARHFTYAGLQTTVTKPTGSSKRSGRDLIRTVRDARGLVTASFEMLTDASGSREISTELDYGPNDALLETRVKRSDGSVAARTVLDYDHLGRRSQITDPDAHQRKSFYNGFDEVREVHDIPTSTATNAPPGLVTTFQRDVLGRLLRRIVCPQVAGCSAPQEDTRFTWDVAPNGVGQLANAITAEGIRDDREYDSLGRPSRHTTSVAGQQFAFDTTYDTVGRPKRLSYPETPGWPRLEVDRSYDPTNGAFNQLTRVDTNSTLWAASQFDAAGRVTQELRGSLTVNRVFALATGRLTSMSARVGSAAPLIDLTYQYFDDGNVSSRGDSATNVSESFEHDSLGRLTTWQAAAAAGTPAWKVDYGYDELGNLTSRTAAAGTSTQVATYHYDRTGNAGPHAVTSWSISGGDQAAASGTFSYDLDGRVDNHSRLGQIAYTSFDLPVSIRGNKNADFLYGPEGRRVYKKDASGTTLYADGLFEVRLPPDGSLQFVLYVGGIGQVVRTRNAIGIRSEKTLIFQQDQLGSVTTVTDAAGLQVERKRTDPFGARVSDVTKPFLVTTDPAPSGSDVREGFAGQEHDEALGVINMKGRLYDPLLGRFLTPDPIVQDSTWTQAQNRYAYVLNAPMRLIDPSGLFWENPEGPPCPRFAYCADGGAKNGEPSSSAQDDDDDDEWSTDAKGNHINKKTGEIVTPKDVRDFEDAFGKGPPQGALVDDTLKQETGKQSQPEEQDKPPEPSLWDRLFGGGGGELRLTDAIPYFGPAIAFMEDLKGAVSTGQGWGFVALDLAFLGADVITGGGGTAARAAGMGVLRAEARPLVEALGKEAAAATSVARPGSFRSGVREEVWDAAIEAKTGQVRDPVTGRFMSPDNPWDMGHKPGFEFRKHQQSAQERGISRQQFLNEYNDPSHYRPELPGSNRSHAGENITDDYFGP